MRRKTMRRGRKTYGKKRGSKTVKIKSSRGGIRL